MLTVPPARPEREEKRKNGGTLRAIRCRHVFSRKIPRPPRVETVLRQCFQLPNAMLEFSSYTRVTSIWRLLSRLLILDNQMCARGACPLRKQTYPRTQVILKIAIVRNCGQIYLTLAHAFGGELPHCLSLSFPPPSGLPRSIPQAGSHQTMGDLRAG